MKLKMKMHIKIITAIKKRLILLSIQLSQNKMMINMKNGK